MSGLVVVQFSLGALQAPHPTLVAFLREHSPFPVTFARAAQDDAWRRHFPKARAFFAPESGAYLVRDGRVIGFVPELAARHGTAVAMTAVASTLIGTFVSSPLDGLGRGIEAMTDAWARQAAHHFVNLLRIIPAEEGPPYALLGLTPGVGIKEIKRRYRELVLKFHPDRQQGASLAVIRESEDRLRRLRIAYLQLLEENSKTKN